MRQLFKTFKVAFQAINKNQSRSLLTMLGIIIGVAAVIMTISAGEGATLEVQKQISGLGTNLLMIYTKTEHRAGAHVRMGKPINKKDFDMLQNNSVWISKLSPLIVEVAQAIGPNGYKSIAIYGVSDQYFDILSRDLSTGEFFKEEEVNAAGKVCVIGETLKKELTNIIKLLN